MKFNAKDFIGAIIILVLLVFVAPQLFQITATPTTAAKCEWQLTYSFTQNDLYSSGICSQGGPSTQSVVYQIVTQKGSGPEYWLMKNEIGASVPCSGFQIGYNIINKDWNFFSSGVWTAKLRAKKTGASDWALQQSVNYDVPNYCLSGSGSPFPTIQPTPSASPNHPSPTPSIRPSSYPSPSPSVTIIPTPTANPSETIEPSIIPEGETSGTTKGECNNDFGVLCDYDNNTILALIVAIILLVIAIIFLSKR